MTNREIAEKIAPDTLSEWIPKGFITTIRHDAERVLNEKDAEIARLKAELEREFAMTNKEKALEILGYRLPIVAGGYAAKDSPMIQAIERALNEKDAEIARLKTLVKDWQGVAEGAQNAAKKANDVAEKALFRGGSVLKKKNCFWKYDDIDDAWSGSCGNYWCFSEGTPEENEVNFCPKCGKRVEAKAPSQEKP